MKQIKTFLLSIICILHTLALHACSDSTTDGPPPEEKDEIRMPQKEFRAAWVATVGRMDWPASTSDIEAQKVQYIRYLDTFVAYNLNAVVMQIRPTADAFYESALEPWSEYITGTRGKSPGYDVMQFMIDETHKRGLEFHAWMNPFRISNSAGSFTPTPGYPGEDRPEWKMRYGNLLMYRPAIPEVRQHLLDVIEDLITRYDVDGIHFDDYFYPYPQTGVEIDDAEDFRIYGQGYTNVEDFRRGNVNTMIEDIHNLVVHVRPGILFGISPYAAWRHKSQDPNGSETSGINNYDDLYADIRLWCEKGWIDYVTPQLYASTQNIALNFIHLCDWWPANSFDVPVLIGYGLYKFGNPHEGDIFMKPEELETQFFYARKQEKVKGAMLFNGTAFTANRIDILSTLGKVYGHKSLIPFMGRKTVAEPFPPAHVRTDGGVLRWEAGNGDLRYAVYHIEDQEAQLLEITRDVSFTLPGKGKYAVSAVNKDQVESSLSEVVTYP
ncbi:MAG: family 10 glycosylhydrolase [Bacteroides sp.]|nr:family 10 glycosylhydrolase [Bacteroides sp.]